MSGLKDVSLKDVGLKDVSLKDVVVPNLRRRINLIATINTLRAAK